MRDALEAVRPARRPVLLVLTLALALAAGCSGDDNDTPTADAGVEGAEDAGPSPSDSGLDAAVDAGQMVDAGDAGVLDAEVLDPARFFAFGTASDQPISAAPFPNDLYLGPGGRVTLAPLQDDPRLGALARRDVLERYTELANERSGFASTAPIWFPTQGAVDESSLAGRVRVITLAGPEAGREVAAQASYSEVYGAVGAFAAWGDYLMAGSTYGVVVTRGVLAVDGSEVQANPSAAALVGADSPEAPAAALDGRFGSLRTWLSETGISPADVLVATVFTTEEVLPYARALFDAVDRFALEPPTRRVRWDGVAEAFEEAPPIDGASLDTYYGVPEAAFEHNPGMWDWNRDHAEHLEGYEQRYEGGTPHPGIGRVQHGSIVVPAYHLARNGGAVTPAPLRFVDGLPSAELKAMVPFTLFFCEEHLADSSNLPVAVFSHGGGAIRVDATAWASANCLAGVATIAIDMVFHGGRTNTSLLPEEGLVVPVTPDRQNTLTGLAEGDEGFERDWIGDRATALEIVGALFGVWQGMDPAVVEANLLAIPSDTATLLRYLKEGDWSAVQPGLSFDSSRIVHEALSFGASFHTPLLALRNDFAGIVGSVGSGMILSVNLMMAPSNAQDAGSVAISALGLRPPASRLQAGALDEPILGLLQWLHERGDPMPYAPHVLRHRPTAPLPPLLHIGDSWDETLYPGAQMSYARALGPIAYTHGSEWTLDPTVPGAAALDFEPAPAAPVRDNVSFGGQTTTAALYEYSGVCHSLVHTSICVQSYAHPYPPIQALPVPEVGPSPLCALHAQISGFLSSIRAGGPAAIGVPEGSCEEVYP